MKTFETKFQTIVGMLLVVFLSFTFTACEEDDEDNNNINDNDQLENIVEIASADDDFSVLVDALIKADLASTLEGDGPLTVFAPTNDAFSQLLDDLGASSLDDITAEQLEPILLYHVLSGKVMSSDLEDDYISSLSTGPDNFEVSLLINAGSLLLNGSAEIIDEDIEASNGVIHVINEVVLPPTVVDIAEDNGNFTALVEALSKAELVSTLNGDGPFTVFAPTDEAFENLLDDLGAESLDDIPVEDLIPILERHVVSGNVRSSDLSSGDVETLNGNISIEAGDQVIINNNATVTAADIQGKNGVVHVIDKVIMPEKNIVEIASDDENFESLVAALTKAELAETLEGEGPFTVFAPTDDAFDQLLDDLGASSLDDLSKEELTPILLYHVLSGNVMSSGLTDGYVKTLSPGAETETNADLLVDASLAELNGSSSITTADIKASNGVIHVIDEVLLPNDVVDLALNNGNFTALVEALTKAELVETLQGDGPFTIFAPTDEAFNDFLDSQGVTLDDLTKEDLEPILLYHAVSGNVSSDELSDGAVATLQGDDVTVSLNDGVLINDANVTLADIQGTNGIIHVIDKVLVPESE